MVQEVMSKEKELISLDQALNLEQKDIEENYRQHINLHLTRLLKMLGFNKTFVRAKDMIVWDKNGEEYLDFLGAYGALNIGHNNDTVINALNSISHLPNLLQSGMHSLPSVLARNLAKITPGDLKYTFFCNSGAEAVEGALKLAKIATEKSRIIYCKGAFHGKSMGALSVTGRNKYKKYFGPMVPLAVEVPYGDINELKLVLEKYDDIAAFIVEPIQGEGGIIVPPIGYLRKAKDICSQYGVLLIADEIQTGFGRTGYWFACEAEGVVPDIMCMAKSLGGGIIPIGAYIANEDVWKRGYGTMDRCLLHTSTFGGNTWASAAGISTIEFIAENNLENEALEKGNYIIGKLLRLKDKYPLLKEVRGRGLMIGLEFDTMNIPLIDRVITNNTRELVDEYTGGIVASELINNYNIITAYTLNNPNVIRIEPPLTVTYEQLDKFASSLEEILMKNRSIGTIALNNTKNLIKSVFNGRR
ncbi:aspartate aminotransferase family protein [Alkaliphilus sp. MSJ-5]|uniref:Aspartate aminotransferase family protein n=1 Tax=Alkaliphilus flagellatus TaxID=2841507 RepID=A0ABS6FX44_9FIRM|nr:aspartate aminotransferase family protein [Alkaliphilus flagellatus]MBU5674798.1 aspartate aminotransferase family protein [Alkaliphilus flagellatus]